MRLVLAVGLATLAFAALAATPLANHFPGMKLVQRVDAPILREGSDDAVFVYSGDEGHRVAVAHFDRKPREAEPIVIDQLELPSSPFDPPHVSVQKRVVVIEQMTGGTMATQATYRFRLDPEQDCMGLIGLDASRYDRMGANDGYRISWNLLTGKFISQRMWAQGSTKKPAPERVSKRAPGAVCMSLIDTPDDLIDAALDAERRR
ncbi:hypothetical protein [Cognatilysobacter terrigena]|uniref:hypothetical protein n=1 Tax=Cognatilysobacter terrigena TaxID=2488749 RepID=UPI00105B553E|nr:hypothetical protein [Lysobacter terrigena]